jgi:hypothetical protein
MKFRDFLKENKEKHAVLAFGRMNPPTTGHEVLVNKVKEVAKEHNASHHVVLSHSQDKAKNPLTAEQKLHHAKRFFPKTNISVATKDEPNFLSQAAKLHKQGVTHLHMVAGSDRVPEYHKLLNKYNGKHEGALFNFKHIQVHSAGERDPDAEGTTGMSASKMRSHASSGNFKEFKKGVPSHVPEHHAKELYNHVRQGMQVKEEIDLNEEFNHLLFEGVHDKGIFKAVFLAGGPGSGKDYVLDNTLAGHGLTEINSDKALEFLMDKEKLDKRMPDEEEQKRDLVRGRAKNITELRQRLALYGRNGVIINGTGDSAEKITNIKEKLEALGYETSMLLVQTDDEVSKQRNIERGQRGGRTVPEKIRKEKWDAVQESRPEFAKMFGDRYMEFDNSEDLRTAPPEVVKSKKEEMLQLYRNVQEFVKTPPSSETAQQWVASELQKKDTLPVPKSGAEMTPHPESGAADEARKLGLQYYGFGRYGKNGQVTHRSVHDKLVAVEKVATSVNEDFENLISNDTKLMNESYSLSDSSALNLLLLGNRVDEQDFDFYQEEDKKVRLMRDSNGRIRTFTLRRAAAKEAHQKNGEIMKYKNGYVIKLKEENDDVQFFENDLCKTNTNQNGRKTPIGWTNTQSNGSYAEAGRTITNASTRTSFTESRGTSSGSGTKTSGGSDDTIKENKEQPWSTKKITIAEVRAKQKEKMIESIDKGIEPGLSMTASGESIARDMGEKLKKKTGKATQVAETIGDGGEMATSMSDQKEDELKKKGIDIKTFRAKRPIG